MKGNFFTQAGITLSVVVSALSLFSGSLLFLEKQILPGILLMLVCPVVLIFLFIVLIRTRKNDQELDPISDSRHTIRQTKNPRTKQVFETDSDIWAQMGKADSER